MLPPYWLLVGVASALALARWLPGEVLPATPARLAGAALVVAGALLALWGERQFARVETGVIPGRKITTFVRTGPYRFTRNPMYLGMVIALTGVALASRATSALVVPLLLLAVLDRRFVRNEEAMLRARFGDAEFEAFSRTVRRWV